MISPVETDGSAPAAQNRSVPRGASPGQVVMALPLRGAWRGDLRAAVLLHSERVTQRLSMSTAGASFRRAARFLAAADGGRRDSPNLLAKLNAELARPPIPDSYEIDGQSRRYGAAAVNVGCMGTRAAGAASAAVEGIGHRREGLDGSDHAFG